MISNVCPLAGGVQKRMRRHKTHAAKGSQPALARTTTVNPFHVHFNFTVRFPASAAPGGGLGSRGGQETGRRPTRTQRDEQRVQRIFASRATVGNGRRRLLMCDPFLPSMEKKGGKSTLSPLPSRRTLGAIVFLPFYRRRICVACVCRGWRWDRGMVAG